MRGLYEASSGWFVLYIYLLDFLGQISFQKVCHEEMFVLVTITRPAAGDVPSKVMTPFLRQCSHVSSALTSGGLRVAIIGDAVCTQVRADYIRCGTVEDTTSSRVPCFDETLVAVHVE